LDAPSAPEEVETNILYAEIPEELMDAGVFVERLADEGSMPTSAGRCILPADVKSRPSPNRVALPPPESVYCRSSFGGDP